VQLKPVAVPPARLSLTPMQEKLMEMFRSAPGQTLTKEEICTALWPKKENPEDTLYTFMSRLKSSLKNQSSLQIVNRRGREYVLLDDDATD
jgi:DNA-binding response OmpR family regulator